MRLAAGIGVVLAVAGCATEPPTSSGGVPVSMSGPLASVRTSGLSDRVQVEMWQRRPDGSETRQQMTFVVSQLDDGVAVFSENPPAEPSGSFRRNGTPWAKSRRPSAGASLSVSEGARLYDADGVPIEPPDMGLLRQRLGLPATPSKPLTPPGPRDEYGRPIGRQVADGQRRGRVVSPERAAKDLSDLRNHAQSEERIADGQLRFRRTDGDVTQSLLYDERIGAVVETAIERAGRKHIVIKNEFDRNAEGAVLTGVVSEWFDTDGQPVRRVTQRFLAQ